MVPCVPVHAAVALSDLDPRARLPRAVLRAPLVLYRHRLGWLLGRRFVYLAHRDRASGRRRETVVEVVRYDPAVAPAPAIRPRPAPQRGDRR